MVDALLLLGLSEARRRVAGRCGRLDELKKALSRSIDI